MPIMSSYPDQESRRYSISTSIPSSKYTENGFTCTRVQCHCDAANREELDPAEAISLEGRRHAEYIYRPPFQGPYPGLWGSDNPSYSNFHYEKLSEAEYCEQCQFCSVLSRWCGRLPLSNLYNRSAVELAERFTKGKMPDTTWVQEPLIVNSAHVLGENMDPREQFPREQLPPAVFSHTITAPSSKELPVHNTTHLREERNPSLESIRICRSMPQRSAENCTRLRLVKDVRGVKREDWAMEEGSLVIGIHPHFVDMPQQHIAEDEFELRYGEVYIVCRMFADLWALCARLRMSEIISPIGDSDRVEHGFENIKFLPLCAVTLAANFANFDRRYAEYRQRYPYSTAFPFGGLRITPPQRCESLVASCELYASNYKSLNVPRIVFNLCKRHPILPPKAEYVPLDPPNTKSGLFRFKNTSNGQGTLRKIWRKLGSSETNETSTEKQNQSDHLPHSAEFSLEKKEIDCIEDEVPSHEEGRSTVKVEGPSKSMKFRNPVKKRKSVREFFFGSRRLKQTEFLEKDSSVEEKEIDGPLIIIDH